MVLHVVLAVLVFICFSLAASRQSSYISFEWMRQWSFILVLSQFIGDQAATSVPLIGWISAVTISAERGLIPFVPQPVDKLDQPLLQVYHSRTPELRGIPALANTAAAQMSLHLLR